jgi:hypothetical protein
VFRLPALVAFAGDRLWRWRVVGVADAEGHVRLRRDQPWAMGRLPGIADRQCRSLRKGPPRRRRPHSARARRRAGVHRPKRQTGAPLSGRCSYEISGTTPPSGSGHCGSAMRMVNRSPRRTRFPVSLTSWTTLRNIDGTFRIRLSPRPRPATGSGSIRRTNVSFVLTLIDTPTAASPGWSNSTCQRSELIGCRDA